MRAATEKERWVAHLRKEAAQAGFWSRFGQIMAGYVVFVLGCMILGDTSSTAVFNVVTLMVVWAAIGAIIAWESADREGRLAVERAEELERRIRAEMDTEKGAERLPS